MNNKFLVIIFFILISTSKVFGSGPDVMTAVFKVLEAVGKATTALAQSVTNSIGGSNVPTQPAPPAPNAEMKFIAEQLTNNGETLRNIQTGVAITATGATAAGAAGSWYIGSSFINWWWPSAEQKALKEKALNDQKILKALMALNKCLIDSKEKEKNKEGIPYLCEPTLEEYTNIAGFVAAKEIKLAYKENNEKK